MNHHNQNGIGSHLASSKLGFSKNQLFLKISQLKYYFLKLKKKISRFLKTTSNGTSSKIASFRIFQFWVKLNIRLAAVITIPDEKVTESFII